MDFDQLTTFVQVSKLKSFSKAGQKVFRSQSAVSAQIRQLEQAYHAKLLDRSAKSVELTPAGVVLFEFVSGCCGCATNPCRWWRTAAMSCKGRSRLAPTKPRACTCCRTSWRNFSGATRW